MQPLRILLIEDNADDAELIAFELDDAGIVRLQALQRNQQRDRGLCSLEQIAHRQCTLRLRPRTHGIARLQRHRR